MALGLLHFTALAALLGSALADLPNHCLHNHIKGDWLFSLGPATNAKENIQCSKGNQMYNDKASNFGLGEPNFLQTNTMKVTLKSPNTAVTTDADGKVHTGTWTMIYDEGFEVRVKDQSFFAYSHFTQEKDGSSYTECGKTMPGWYHPLNLVDTAAWGCYTGTKLTDVPAKQKFRKFGKTPIKGSVLLASQPGDVEDKAVEFINTHPESTWIARKYAEHERPHPLALGNKISFDEQYERPEGFDQAAVDVDIKDIPRDFDWNDVNGVSFVDPVINQGSCGSCYSVSTADMFSSRARIASKNTKGAAYRASPQSVLSQRGFFAQGCQGGFPYLASKYGKDFGATSFEQVPYTAKDVQTGVSPAPKQIVSRMHDYHYVGGYYGATTENNMLREIFDHGPVVVGIEVAPTFSMYSSGVYDSNIQLPDKDHYERVNHAVLVTGFGTENGNKYWNVKNSWGPHWGDKGYIKVGRGTDVMNIEHMVVAAYPALTKTLPVKDTAVPQILLTGSMGHIALRNVRKGDVPTAAVSDELNGEQIEKISDPAFLRASERLEEEDVASLRDGVVDEDQHQFVE